MARFWFFGAGGFGHINPMLPIARELRRRGHEIAFYATPEFEQIVQRAGLDFRAYPPSMDSAELSRALQTGNLWASWAGIMRNAEKLTPFLLSELQADDPDGIVFDCLSIPGQIAGRRLGIPAASTIPYFLFELAEFGKGWRENVKLIRQLLPALPSLLGSGFKLGFRYGPHNYPGKGPFFPVMGNTNIVFTTRGLQPPSPRIDRNVHFVGPSIDELTRSETFDFSKLDGRPLIYVSLGTVHTADHDFFRTLMRAMATLDAQIVMSVGRGTDIAALGPIPDNHLLFPAVPQLQILERASLFLTHAGMNSLHESLWYGVPMLAIPQQFEQLVNARIVQRRGALKVLDGHVTGQKISAETIRREVQGLLADSRAREAAQKLKSEMRLLGGFAEAADAIEAMPQRHRNLRPRPSIIPLPPPSPRG